MLLLTLFQVLVCLAYYLWASAIIAATVSSGVRGVKGGITYSQARPVHLAYSRFLHVFRARRDRVAAVPFVVMSRPCEEPHLVRFQNPVRPGTFWIPGLEYPGTGIRVP